MNKEQFESAKNKIIGIKRNRNGIGTLSEKTVHAILKNYYEPDEDYHEIPVNGYVADIYRDGNIIEIQTANFNKLRNKLDVFLNDYQVTVVYPMPYIKWLCWLDEETGYIGPKRKSPKKGNPYEAFYQLYKIKSYLTNPNIRIKIVMMNMEEIRLLNGWSKDKKKGSSRFDRIPTEIVEEIDLYSLEDYMQMVLIELAETFCSKDYAKAAHLSIGMAQTALNILTYTGTVKRIGKRGNEILYNINENV
ncbi:MAG: hypothetical protein SPL51_01710 [Lachnospiraceae bacterium]|nr:hypothetical protein [Lachnospiraceae bacterium]